MFVILIVSVFAFFLALLDSKKILKDGLLYAFILLTIIAAIRYDYGNDYKSYERIFETANRYSLSYVIEEHENLQYIDSTFKDIGAVILYKLFKPVGFLIFVAVASIFTNATFYKLIKDNLCREQYWIGIFIYLFQFDFYVLPMSMIRQSLAIAICIWGVHFLVRKKYLFFIISYLIALSIHKSSAVFIPFLGIYFIPIWRGRIVFWVIIAATLIVNFSSVFVNELLQGALGIESFIIYFQSYGNDAVGELGFVRKFLNYAMYFLALYYLYTQKPTKHQYYLVMLSVVGFMFLPIAEMIPLVSRLSFYFNVFYIVSIPLALRIIKNQIVRISVANLIFIALLYQYYYLFTNSIYTKYFIEYTSILSLI